MRIIFRIINVYVYLWCSYILQIQKQTHHSLEASAAGTMISFRQLLHTKHSSQVLESIRVQGSRNLESGAWHIRIWALGFFLQCVWVMDFM